MENGHISLCGKKRGSRGRVLRDEQKWDRTSEAHEGILVSWCHWRVLSKKYYSDCSFEKGFWENKGGGGRTLRKLWQWSRWEISEWVWGGVQMLDVCVRQSQQDFRQTGCCMWERKSQGNCKVFDLSSWTDGAFIERAKMVYYFFSMCTNDAFLSLW